ncbi:MAG: hypothetical protein KDL31_03840 [Kiritimatiellae bacterium]|nr:hypothetical protein [Kiritimatiellia bacterium]
MLVGGLLPCLFAAGSAVRADEAIPYLFESITAADAARPVQVSMDGDVAAVIDPGLVREGGGRTNTVLTYFRSGGAWDKVDLLPGPGRALAVDVDACRMAVGLEGGVEVWAISCGSSKPGWLFDSAVSLSNPLYRASGVDLVGDRMAVRIDRSTSPFGGNAFIAIYDKVGTGWVFRAEAGVMASNELSGTTYLEADAFDLDGDRLAVASPARNVIQIRERDAGGANAWGVVAVISNQPSGLVQLGYELALDGGRLAATGLDAVSGLPHLLVYSNHTGGVGAWGVAGTLLSQPAAIGNLTLDTEGGRLAALGYPALDDLFTSSRPGILWVFANGAGPGGWTLERTRTTGAFNWNLYTLIYESLIGWPRPSLSGTNLMVGVAATNTAGDKAGWAASVHTLNQDGPAQWGPTFTLEAPGAAYQFGYAVDMDGSFLVVGMPNDDWGGTNTGAAYVWYLSDAGNARSWHPVARLTAPNGEPNHQFGFSVSVTSTNASTARIAVGAPFEFGDKGAVYLFDVQAYFGQLAPARRIAPTPYPTNLAFGAAVSVDRDKLAVGAPIGDLNGLNWGMVYLFEEDFGGANAWGCRVTNGAPNNGVNFGFTLDLENDTLAVGRPSPGGSGPAVFMYDRDEGGPNAWGLVDTLPPPADSPNGFAWSVDIIGSGNSVLVGAIDSFGITNGKVYLFATLTGTTYDVLLTLDDPEDDGAQFGYAVEWIDFGGILVGAPTSTHGATGGVTRLFGLSLTGGVTNVYTVASLFGEAPGDRLGSSVAGSALYAVAGAPRNDANGNNAGMVRSMRAGPYEIWAGGQPPVFGSAWLPWQDYDADGDANLMEFAMGTDPTSGISTSKLIMTVQSVSGGQAMGWMRPSLPYSTVGLHYNMQRSEDMTRWLNAPYAVSFTNSNLRLYDLGGGWQHYRLAPRYPVLSSEDGGGGIIVVLD